MDLSWRPVQLALRLARDGVQFVVVGGTARRLLGWEHAPPDLDIVVTDLGPVGRSASRSGATTARTPSRLWTGLEPLDVFEGRVLSTREVQVGGTVLTVDAAA